MSGVEEDESGGGVMVVFSTDSDKQSEVSEAMRYTAQALRQHSLTVTEHDSSLEKYGVKKSAPKPRCVYALRCIMRVYSCNMIAPAANRGTQIMR